MKALGTPPGDREELDRIYQAMQGDLDAKRRDPAAKAKADPLLDRYGLTSCT